MVGSSLRISVSRCILAKWGLKVWEYSIPINPCCSFKVHPRKMRIESPKSCHIDRTYHAFQGASSQNEDWKIEWIHFLLEAYECFKVHPRKMRIESFMATKYTSSRPSFQGASSQNEDWKGLYFSSNISRAFVSRCILAKWGLKVYLYSDGQGGYYSFKVHPRKMRIESLLYVLSGLFWSLFQGASSQNEDWKQDVSIS